MPYMEVTSQQCRWVCSLQLLATWEKKCQCTHIWCSQPQLLAWTSPLCWMDVCPQRPSWLPPSRQICRMPTKSRVPTKVGLMMTSLKQRIRARARLYVLWCRLETCLASVSCQQDTLASQVSSLHQSQLWLVACAAPGADSDVVSFHHSRSGVALCTFVVVYGIVLGCMSYCACADPGQVKQTRKMKIGAVGGMDIEGGLPRRAHKSWQFSRPIRRYHHYCKWVNMSSVFWEDRWHFLPNHREFVIMVAGLLLLGVLGIMVDIWLAILIAEKGFFKFEIVVALHLGKSVALLAIDGPIFKIHFGLISRNEMAQEWKKNEHYVANNTSIGDNVPVEDLEDDEYNELFDRDAFVYDGTRNPFDNGCFTNCLNFWCQPRWTSDEKGEF